MILKGNERSHGEELAHHLLNPRDNDHVTVYAVEGFVADDLFGAFAEAEAISAATQCQKYLFSLSINPPPDASVPVEAFEKAIAAIESKLGLVGQPRAIVFHEKKGRRHAHVVWSRIDASKMRSINLPHYKRKLMDVSRELYRIHEWKIPEGFRDPEARDPNNFRYEEAAQAKRVDTDPKAQKALFRACWEQSDSRAAFAAALWDQGYLLARGDRRGFVAVDAECKIWSLSRWCGAKPRDLRARLGSEDELWSIDEAVAAFADLMRRDSAKQGTKAAEDFEHRREELIQRQRQERIDLRAAQDARHFSELKARQAWLPKGLKAVWAKLTGQYEALLREFARDAALTEQRDRDEGQALIDRHLEERQALQRSRDHASAFDDLHVAFDHVAKPDPRQRLVLTRDDIPFSEQELIAKPELICVHVSHKQASFTRADILRALAQRIRDPMMLRSSADRAMSWADVIPLDESADQDRVTTKDYLAAARSLDAVAVELVKTKRFAVAKGHVSASILTQNKEMQAQFGGRLSDEQDAAVHHVLGAEQLALVVGLAGAGKSTMLKTAHAAWTRQGVKVHGAALAGKAADGLESASGIPSRTLASLETSWANGYAPIGHGDVLVIDEAGMVGTRQLSRIAKKLHAIGAKLVLVGDPDQLQPIEAGTPFRELIEQHGAAHLTEIHRQHEDWQKQASRDLAKGDVAQAIDAYAARGRVRQTATLNGALAALVEDYLADFELHGANCSRLAFAHRRKDVYALNQAIRTGLRLTGNASPETLLDTETGPRAFAPGDRIVFTRNDKTIGVKNGSLGTVKKVGARQLVATLDNGREVRFDPRQFNAFDHGYAVTIHKSQGATVDRSYILASRTMDNSLTYVAITRHKQGVRLYINEEDRPVWGSGRPMAKYSPISRNRDGPMR